MPENTQPKIRNDFSKVVDAYAKYRRDYIDKVYDLIYEFCPDRGSFVLDMGCGTGLVTNHLAGYYKHITGTDKSQEMLEVARKTASANTAFVVASAEQLPFEDNSFGLITVAAAYHWFDHDKASKEIYRVLKPKGKLCVFWKYAPGNPSYLPEFATENLKKFLPDINREYKETSSVDMFLEAGFTKVDDEEFDFDDSYSKEEILGYIQSHSTYNLLDESQKEEYKRLNEKSVDLYLVNSKFIFKSRMEMWFIEK